MDRSEFIYCYEVLRKDPPFFYSTRDYRNKIECLRRLRAEATPSNVGELFSLLKLKNDSVRFRVASIVLFLSRKLKSQKQLYFNLKYLKIEKADIDFYKRSYPPEILVDILGIVSLNHNGYIRERALKELGELNRPEAIRYILFRLGDWTSQVRETAQKTLTLFLTDANIKALIGELPFIDALNQVKRVDLTSVQNDMLRFVCSIDLTESFYKSLRVSDKSRLLFLRNYVRINGFRSDYFKFFLMDRSFVVRKEALKFLSNLSREERKEMFAKLATDRSAHVRTAILLSLTRIDSDIEPIAFNMIFDTSASVRELVRFLLKGKYDYPSIYRERVRVAGDPGSILGLGETGSLEDIDLLKEAIKKDSVAVKLACIQAFKCLDISVAKECCLDLFMNDSGKIRKRCIDILAQTYNGETEEKMTVAYSLADVIRKKTILDIYNKVGGWSAIGLLIRAVSEDDLVLRQTAWDYLKRWRDRMTNYFVTPSEDQIRRAVRLHELTDTNKLKLNPGQLALWKEVRYCLN